MPPGEGPQEPSPAPKVNPHALPAALTEALEAAASATPDEATAAPDPSVRFADDPDQVPLDERLTDLVGEDGEIDPDKLQGLNKPGSGLTRQLRTAEEQAKAADNADGDLAAQNEKPAEDPDAGLGL